MFIDWSKVKIYLKTGDTDCRKSINGLSIIVREELGKDVFSGNLFLFCNRDKNKLKILYWDRNGFCLWYKRLETDKFPWPKTTVDLKELSRHQLSMLLDGIDFFKAHKKLNYKDVA